MNATAGITAILVMCLPTAFGYSWYSTTWQMGNLIREDLAMLRQIRNFTTERKAELANAKERIMEARSEARNLLHNIRNKSSHPISWYKLSTQLVTDFGALSEMRKTDVRTLMEIVQLTRALVFPMESDRAVVAESLLHIQISKSLDTWHLADGYVGEYFSGRRMSADECVSMAEEACGKGYKTICRQWYNVALRRVEVGEPCSTSKTSLKQMLEWEEEEALYQDLCAGNKVEPPQDRGRSLKCYMWDNFRDPWLLFQPVCMEELSHSPNIVRFYDVISDDEIQTVKFLSETSLKNAGTEGEDESIPKTLKSVRVAHHAWLHGKTHTTVQRLNERIASLVGLSLETSENLQIATYGIGGHYGAHYDHARADEEIPPLRSNDRKATFMFYLSDVQLGGETVFLHPRITVKPIKGSAVFWHNLLPDGRGDNRTKHGACHEAVGAKWIANKWIRETYGEVCKKSDYIGRIH